jgi:two-component response regulator (ARR-A family)
MPAGHVVIDGTSSRRAHLTEIAMARHRSRHHSIPQHHLNRMMLRNSSSFPCCCVFFQVLHSSSAGLSHYFPFLFKFILLVYAILCLGELLHRWSNGSFLSMW